MQINVTKRDGSLQLFDLEKVHKVLEWATEGITGVSQSEIEIRANLQLYDKVPAYDIHELIIKSSSELISEHTPNYQFVAARLISYKLRKEVYGQYEPWPLIDLVKKNIELGVYDSSILEKYSELSKGTRDGKLSIDITSNKSFTFNIGSFQVVLLEYTGKGFNGLL